MLPYIFLLNNSCHFAASTVRLYTKPGATAALPFLSMMFPLVAFAVLTVCMVYPDDFGHAFNSLYLTWSPFHYAAQAYGLAVMYSYRSGCLLEKADKRLLWWVSMVPFFYAFMYADDVGVRWLAPGLWDLAYLKAPRTMYALSYVFYALGFAAPVLLYLKVWMGKKAAPMPLIAVMAIIANTIWFFVLAPLQAFTWATLFHGIQYLAIIIIFHVKDQMARPENRHRVLYHVVTFYLLCLCLAYALFQCVPMAYKLAGFGNPESVLLVAAAINIHHFIVDAYIWRLKKTDGNRKIVDAGLPAPEAAATV
jgi:hypothetical protein